MKHKEQKIKSSLPIGYFINQMVDNSDYYISIDALAFNKARTQIYVNPYAYACIESDKDDENENDPIFFIQLSKVGKKYEIDADKVLYPEVVDTCPEGWITIPINVISEEDFIDPYPVEERDIEEAWSDYTAERMVSAFISLCRSMMRSGMSSLSSMPDVKVMKKIICQKIQKQRKLMYLQHVLEPLEMEIVTQKLSETHSKEYVEMLEAILLIVDQKISKLTTKNKVNKPLKEISKEELQSKLVDYTLKDKQDFIAFVESDDSTVTSEDYHKAAIIRTHLESKVTKH